MRVDTCLLDQLEVYHIVENRARPHGPFGPIVAGIYQTPVQRIKSNDRNRPSISAEILIFELAKSAIASPDKEFEAVISPGSAFPERNPPEVCAR